MPALPGVRPPGPSQLGSPGNIGRLLPAISPAPVAYSPNGTWHVAFGRYDSVSMGTGTPDPSGPGVPVLAAVAAAIVIATAGGWLAVSARARKRGP